ncbi:MAG: phosphatase PAP2 family protein [Parcubacteria group bacterium]
MSFFLNIDSHVENFFLSIRGQGGVDFFSAVTWLGEWKILIFVVVLIAVIFWLKNKKEYILPFLITVGGAGISGQIFKIIFERVRPIGDLKTGDPFSFPSGHALIAVAFYGFLVYYFWQTSKDQVQKYFFLIMGLILILLIGASRLYLDMHYFSDVIGGYILGAIWLAIGIYFHRKNSKTSAV